MTILTRLNGILDMENERLSTDPNFDIGSSNIRKSRCLYELTMLMKTMPVGSESEDVTALLKAMRKKLVVNENRLKAHMEAVRNVTDLLKTAAREAEDDGTYSYEQFQVG